MIPKIFFFVFCCHFLLTFLFYEKKQQSIKNTPFVVVERVKLHPPPPKPKPKPIAKPQPVAKTAPVKKPVPISKSPAKKPTPAPKKIPTPAKKSAPAIKAPPPPLNLDTLLQAHFQTFHLPEYGEVILELTIKQGKIASIKVIKSESEENLNYLKEALQKFPLPHLDKNRTEVLIIQFNNKVEA
ncbi:MAG: hypothetical protein K940chlam8_01063 [Chlamydiae bacterium]|nr:hypothetical protein [Chlamydiota bacterium]